MLAWSFRDQHHLGHEAPFGLHDGGRDARRDLDAIVRRAFGADASAVGRRAVRSSAPDAMAEADAQASLVMLGARGMGGFRELLPGSVTREVLHRITTPIVVVRTTTV